MAVRISRRRFLGASVATVAGLGAAARAEPAEVKPKADPVAPRAPERSPDLVEVEGDDPSKMLAAAIAPLGGIAAFVKKGERVVLKPNASFPNPSEWGTTTNPALVTAVARACLEAGAAKVTVVEFPLSDPKRCLERCGLGAALATVPEVELLIVGDDDDFAQVEIPEAVSLKSVRVARALLAADALINLPVVKAHRGARVSFGLKNSMGLIQDRKAFHGKYELDQAIADLGLAIRPRLTVLDATRCLVSNGPRGPGETATPRRIVAGRASASVDAHGLTLARFDGKQLQPADVAHIALASKAGLGEIDLAKLAVRKLSS